MIRAGHRSHCFLPGRRNGLEVPKSNVPRFSRHTNPGNQPEKDTRFVTAHQTLRDDRQHASYVILSVRQQAVYSAEAK